MPQQFLSFQLAPFRYTIPKAADAVQRQGLDHRNEEIIGK